MSDEQLERLGRIISGEAKPVNETERIFLKAYELVYYENKSPNDFSSEVDLESMIDTPGGIMMLGAVMAVMKRNLNNEAFLEGGDKSKIH